MRILLINGSPKEKRSNSLRLAESFIGGVQDALAKAGDQPSLEELHVADMHIEPCKGCFACWRKTPGICCIHDDMRTVIEKELWADLIVWSFPLYYFSVPGILKNLIDRQLPMNLPFMSDSNKGYGSGAHDMRYDMEGTRHVLISTCGFYSAEGNYDSVRTMFDHFVGKGDYESIFCGQGELFRVKELSARTGAYLSAVRRAGAEYIAGGITDETDKALHELLYPKEVFEEMADASWGISKETGGKEAEDLIFTRQMAALYRKDAYDGKDRVLEMHYTDLGSTYQILLGKDGSRVFTDGQLSPTTRIDTPFEVWSAISRGEIGGVEALGKQMYTVSGDFSLMIDWDKYFSGTSGEVLREESTSVRSEALMKPSMATMLIPWIAFWVAVSIDASVGSLISLVVAAFVPIIMRKHEFVLWDRLSIAAVAVLSAAAGISGNGDIFTNLGYLVFGLMWLLSCLTREPLCASYVKYGYGGESALDNPLFMKTNYILAACWGVLYVLTAVWTWFGRQAGYGTMLIVVNNLAPIAMGWFTVWFEKWYPAHLAKGKAR